MEPVPKLVVAASIVDESIGSVKNTIHAATVREALEQGTKLRHGSIECSILRED